MRALTEDDAGDLCRVYSGESLRWTRGMDSPLTPDIVREKIVTAARSPWHLGIDVSGDLIGLIKARCRHGGLAAVSFILRQDTWGHGYATDALRQFVPLFFEAPDVERLQARHHPRNPASGRVLAKAGFTHVEDVRTGLPGGVVEYALYELRR